MRNLQSASESWQEFKKYQSLQELREAVRLDGHHTSAASTGLRSVCWKAMLLFESVNTEEWPKITSSSRSAYNSLRMHFLKHLENPDDIADGADPLSEDNETSIWTQIRKDEELRAEIMQDVDRCMPEMTYFRQPDTQRAMLDILFIFCKLNQDVGYRQGMHELLAPILWVVERDAIDLGQSSKALGEDAVVRAVFDAEHVEHDAFTLFSQVMHSAKSSYEQTTHAATDNPIVIRSQRIFNEILPQIDPDLAKHLADLDVVPQVFLMRWIRLLFGREFSFDEMLTVWDVLFLEDPTLQLVDHICIAMLLRIRWELMDADYNGVLTLLLRYPPPEKDYPPQTLVMDALYLRNHMHPEGGNYLVLKYTGRPLRPQSRPLTPPALQRNITTFSGIPPTKASGSPLRSGRSQSNIENLLQSTAKNIYARGEKLGIGKVVRNAVDEVHKKALEIRDAQGSSPNASWRVRGSPDRASGFGTTKRLSELEDRNKQLSGLLKIAVDELWECQKLASERSENDRDANHDDVEKLTVAIAKVGFVQVYLEDLNLPLPDSESVTRDSDHQKDPADESAQVNVDSSRKQEPITKETTLEHAESKTSDQERIEQHEDHLESLADPSTFETDSPPRTSPTPPKESAHDSKMNISSTPTPPMPPRPPLDQSSFSWMLGEPASTASASFSQAAPFSAEHRGSGGALFDVGSKDRNRTVESVATTKRSAKTRGQRTNASAVTVLSTDEDVFDLSSLRRAKKS
ncbi:Hypothetical protein R9X50_00127500 [Acrodontium crateriforme]|uniref:Rab-GAP TBC domain-containing protein n=1 Tax=Acrodontium crateriforme TaxID=150365 RepID=A0AAQ3R803_9PEZI|nr:Hypothetical protein R9X50_00127500 [Acrodontium crateriforme]